MLKLYDLDTAKSTILRRPRAGIGLSECAPAVMERTAQLFGPGVTPAMAVTQILASVREQGDAALQHWSEVLDGVPPGALRADLRVPVEELRAAYESLPPALERAMSTAAGRIREFHQLQPVAGWTTNKLGGTVGQRVTPIQRVGIYVPGGTAPLPSSLLMSAIPARVAGVPEILVCTPPGTAGERRGTTGAEQARPHAAILAAAFLCDIEQVYLVGGAQAIASMAFGTESIPRVDKIVGAGNLFVTLAKQQVYGVVGLDGLAGPTETMIIADATARPAWVAADLLAQAEHDVLASAILLTADRGLALAVQEEVERQAAALPRAEIFAQSLQARGGVVLVPNLETAAALADDYAPEHLCLAVADPEALAAQIHHAGGLFLGERSFEVLGDYVAGPSHVMPTGGTARFASPLNVLDFCRISSVIALDAATSAALCPAAAQLAQAESLAAHAAAAQLRVEDSRVR